MYDLNNNNNIVEINKKSIKLFNILNKFKIEHGCELLSNSLEHFFDGSWVS